MHRRLLGAAAAIALTAAPLFAPAVANAATAAPAASAYTPSTSYLWQCVEDAGVRYSVTLNSGGPYECMSPNYGGYDIVLDPTYGYCLPGYELSQYYEPGYPIGSWYETCAPVS